MIISRYIISINSTTLVTKQGLKIDIASILEITYDENITVLWIPSFKQITN